MDLILVGAGGHGRVVADAARADKYSNIAFLDDSFPNLRLSGIWHVVGKVSDFHKFDNSFFCVSIGNNSLRLELLNKIAKERHIVSVIHPKSVQSTFSSWGAGCMFLAGSVLNHNAKIGNGVIVNTNAVVEHDCVLGNGAHICPNASLGGNVKVGDRSWIGIGSCVKHGVTIGEDVMVGAGAVVIRDVPSGTTVVGNPARVIRPTTHELQSLRSRA